MSNTSPELQARVQAASEHLKQVRAEMGRVLAPLAEIVHAYDCDVLLLSGRPSRLPGIRALVMELLPLPPERVISLHDYRVGAWYPFRDARLRVEDPKTTVAVGAMIAALAQSQRAGGDQGLGEAPPRHDGYRRASDEVPTRVDDRLERDRHGGANRQVVLPPL